MISPNIMITRGAALSFIHSSERRRLHPQEPEHFYVRKLCIKQSATLCSLVLKTISLPFLVVFLLIDFPCRLIFHCGRLHRCQIEEISILLWSVCRLQDMKLKLKKNLSFIAGTSQYKTKLENPMKRTHRHEGDREAEQTKTKGLNTQRMMREQETDGEHSWDQLHTTRQRMES